VTSFLTIVGLGYVGLPLAQEACRSGLTVVGLDTEQAVVASLSSGESHIDDVDSTGVAEMLAALGLV
jgi:UDP-N-acetyl-D-mannosaminuronate dehydrogenase